MENQYLLVLPLEPFEIGDSYQPGTELPLHCTVMPWFAIDDVLTFEHLNRRLDSLVSSISCRDLTLKSLRPALFGPNEDIPVHVLENNETLNMVHTRVLLLLGSMDSFPKDLRWVGAGYRPHVTSTHREFRPGSVHAARALAVVRRDASEVKEVVAVHSFLDAAI